MNREGVIVTSFDIDRADQIKLFQVKIRREVKNIIGVEMSMRWISGTLPTPASVPGPPPGPPSWPPPAPIAGTPFLIRRNQLVGELKLQSYEKANIFYTGDLIIDQNIDNRDFTASKFSPKVYTHQMSQHEDETKVSGTTTLVQGVFRNKFPTVGVFQYRVMVYIWVVVKEDQSNL